MKSSLVFKSLLLGLAVFSTSCGSGDTLGEALTREYNTYNGEFKSLGSVKVNDTVTHLFEEDDGTILYAYSDRYDLDDSLNARVEAYGVVTTYETLDKALFEVKRIGEATEETEQNEEVTTVDYTNAALGIRFTHPSNWNVRTEDDTRTVLEGPLLGMDESTVSTGTDVAPDESELVNTEAQVQADKVEFVKLSASLTSTSDSDQETRASEIRNYVSSHFPDTAGVTGDLTYVGTDRVVGLRYKLEDGDIYVFAPRGSDLFELHYSFLSADDAMRIDNTNVFTSMVASFRFIPEGETGSETLEETPETEVSTSDESSAPSVSQVEVSKWTTLSSTAFAFSMSVPSAWYYVGGSTGYTFDLEAIEDVNATGIIKLSFNSSTSEGTARNGESVSITKKVESRYYTLTGAAEYETVMKTMLDSIKAS